MSAVVEVARELRKSEPRLRLSFGASINSSSVDRLELTFTELHAFIGANRCPEKGGTNLVAPMRGGVRNAENAEPTQVVWLDCDNIPTARLAQEVMRRLRCYRSIR